MIVRETHSIKMFVVFVKKNSIDKNCIELNFYLVLFSIFLFIFAGAANAFLNLQRSRQQLPSCLYESYHSVNSD